MSYENQRDIAELKIKNDALEQKIHSLKVDRDIKTASNTVGPAFDALNDTRAKMDDALDQAQDRFISQMSNGLRFPENGGLIPLKDNVQKKFVFLINKLEKGELEEQDTPQWIE